MSQNGFSSLVFTLAGQRLLAKAQAGTELQFTRVAVGDGYLPLGQDETALTALVDQKMSLSITSIVVTDPQATICSVLSNAALTTGFYWREIGLFAQDPALGEILFGYDNAGNYATYVPDNGTSSFVAPLNIAITISNVSSVAATINPYLPAHAATHMGGADPINPAGIGAAAASDLVAHEDDDTKHTVYTGLTTNVGNAYSCTVPNLTALTDGLPLRVKFNVASTGAITVNPSGLGAKSVVDYFGNAIANVRANLIANLVYNTTTGNFTLLGKGGGGNATAAQLLLNATATGDAGPIVGSMPNNPSPAATITTQNGQVTVSAGYGPGGIIRAILTNFAAAVIAAGQTVGGVLGTFTSDATAPPAQILAGYNAYINGVKVTGTMPEASYSSPVMPGTGQQQIAAGHHSGAGNDAVAGDANHVAANIKAGVTDFNVTGTYNGIKSIQYGSITIPNSNPSPNSATTPISSVTMSNAVVIPLGWYSTNGSVNDPRDSPILSLTGPTTVNATKTGNTGFITYASFMVIEFSSLKSNQAGTIALSASTIAHISAVNPTKALCFATGYTGGGGLGEDMMSVTLTNSTTVTATSGRALSNPQIGYVVAEFY